MFSFHRFKLARIRFGYRCMLNLLSKLRWTKTEACPDPDVDLLV